MTSEQISAVPLISANSVENSLIGFLKERINIAVDPDHDIFAAGLVSSMFAMELVVHLEQTHGVSILGPDLQLDNFRTIRSMTALVLRLRSVVADDA